MIIELSKETSTKILAEKDSSSIAPYYSSFPPALELYNRFLPALFDVLFFLNIPGKWDYEFTCIQRLISMLKWYQRAIEYISPSIPCRDVQRYSSIVKKTLNSISQKELLADFYDVVKCPPTKPGKVPRKAVVCKQRAKYFLDCLWRMLKFCLGKWKEVLHCWDWTVFLNITEFKVKILQQCNRM